MYAQRVTVWKLKKKKKNIKKNKMMDLFNLVNF